MTAPRQYVSARELNGQRLTISFSAGADYQALGLRGFFEYRDLGVKAATGGRFHAQVVRAKKGSVQPTGRHSHALEFQMIFVLRGRATVEFEGEGRFEVKAGDVIMQPPGMKHEVLDFSEDHEFLEITSPAEYDTTPG